MAWLENMEILKNSFPDIWQAMLELKDKLDTGLVDAVTSKKGFINLKVNEEFIHGKGDPHKEARDFIKQFQNVAEHSDILFYGLGMGYQVKAFMEQYPNMPFAIYEPVPEIFYQFLCNADLNDLPFRLLKNIYLESQPEDMDMYTANIAAGIRSSIMIIELPSYQTIFPEKRAAFFNRFAGLIEERSHSIGTLAAFQKRWTINSVKNLTSLLKTPHIVLEKKGCYGNKPAILAASGPSLDDEIENLRIIKDKGLAFIFSAGTAVNTLVKQGIYPDAACTYDPSKENQLVFKDYWEKDIKSIPLIYGSTVGYEMVERYPGPQSHMLISQDALAAYYLKPKNGGELDFIADGSTIAVIALQLLNKLGFSPIILVGLNLAFRNGMQYAADSTFFPLEASPDDLQNASMVKDVYGNSVASTYSFNGMRRQIESYLEQFRHLEVINTTQYGAHIEGSTFQSLSELVGTRLQEQVVEDNWWECNVPSYDIDYLIGQHKKMKNACHELNGLFEQCRVNLDTISQTAPTQDVRLIGSSYDQFNLSMEKLRSNLFFTTLIEPMNRVELQFLMLAVPEISREQNPFLKAEMMEKEFGSFLQGCTNDFQLLNQLFQEMDTKISNYYKSYIIRKKAKQIKLLLIDGDGILTDGAVYYSSSGDGYKKFNYKDRSGILKLNGLDIQCLLINPEDDPVLKNAAVKMGINSIYAENKEQILAALAETYQPEELACIWSEVRESDYELLKQVGLSFALPEASPDFKNEADYVLKSGGGEGVINEIAGLLAIDNC